eukprot:jgi/Ulvmu1/8600/UM045_0043.1
MPVWVCIVCMQVAVLVLQLLSSGHAVEGRLAEHRLVAPASSREAAVELREQLTASEEPHAYAVLPDDFEIQAADISAAGDDEEVPFELEELYDLGPSSRKLLHGCHKRKCLQPCPRCTYPSGPKKGGHCKKGGKIRQCPPKKKTSRWRGAEHKMAADMHATGKDSKGGK